VSGRRGGGEPLPPFFRIGLFLLSEDGWESEKAFDLFGGGLSPPRRKSSEDKDSSSNAFALVISILGLPHLKSNRLSRQRL
jgi:hypothetical protein